MLSYEVKVNVIMLAPTMKHGIFHQGNCLLVIDIYNDRYDVTSRKLLHEVPKPNGVTYRYYGCHELEFTRQQSNKLCF